MIYSINRLDFNIAYACNLSCKGCISLSNFPRKGVESFESLKAQCETWCNIVNPKIISIFGGEPLMHPRLVDVLFLIRKHWPNTTIRLVTNGYLLKKYEPADWFKFGSFEMQISIHRKDHEPVLNEEIKKILRCKHKWRPFRGKKNKTHRDIGFVHKHVTIYKSRFKDFVMPYNFKDNKIMPFESDPKKAHAICGSPDTPILYKNKLFKCAPIANILDLDINNLYNYEGLNSKGNIQAFISNINKPESICAMCPENKIHSVDHFNKENVHVKNFD